MEKLSFDRLPKFRLCNFRHFEEGEKHITRVWYTHVAIFMLDGVLRFTEDGREVELCKNQYYILTHFRHLFIVMICIIKHTKITL